MPSLLIDVEARYAQFRDAMERVGSQGEKAGKRIKDSFSGVGSILGQLAGLGTLGGLFSAGGLFTITKSFADQADELSKLNQRTGIQVEQLQKLQYAASLGDATNEDLNAGLRTLAKNMADTAAGTGRARAAFEALGLTQDIQNGKFANAGDLFLEVAERLSQYADGANKSAIAQKIFGDTGERLLPTLNSGAKGIREMGEEAQRFGIILSSDIAYKAADFNDNLRRIQTIAEALKITIGTSLLPAFADLAQEMVDGTRIAGGFWEALARFGTLDPFKKAGENLKDIRAEIKYLEGALARMDASGKQTDATPERGIVLRVNAESRLAKLRQQAEFLRGMEQRAAVLAGEDNRDPRDVAARRGAGQGKQAPKLTKPEDVSALDRASPVLKGLQQEIAAERELMVARNQMLAQFNSDNLISFRQYYEARASVRKEALDKSRAAYDEEISILRDQLAKSSSVKERIKIEEEIAQAVEKRSKLEQDAASESTSDWLEQQRAAKQYEAQIIDLTARMAELRGEAGKAELVRFDLNNAPLRQRLEIEASPANTDEVSRAKAQSALEELAAYRELVAAQAESNALLEKASLIQQGLETAERRLSTDREAGIVTELEMMGKLGTARKDSVEQLEEIAQRLKEVADASGDPRLIANAEAFNAKLGELRQSSDVLGNKFKSVFEDSFASSFSDIITGTKSVSDAFKDMANAIFNQISRIAAQNIADELFGKSGGGGGSSSLFGAAGQFFAKLFGGGASPSALGNAFAPERVAAFAKGGAFSSSVVGSPTLFRFASGGQFRTGIMGEAGPEAVMPLKRTADGRLGVVAAGGDGGTVKVEMNIHGVQDADSFRRSEAQILGRLTSAVSRGRRNS